MKKELYWIAAVLLLTMMIGLLIFGGRLFNGRLLDVQLHDTYFVFPKSLFLGSIFTLLLGTTYIGRYIHTTLNNKKLNVSVVVVFTVLLAALGVFWMWNYSYVTDNKYYFTFESPHIERISEYTIIHWTLTILILTILFINLIAANKVVKQFKKN